MSFGLLLRRMSVAGLHLVFRACIDTCRPRKNCGLAGWSVPRVADGDSLACCTTAQIEDGPRNESRTHGIGFADRSVLPFRHPWKIVQGGISTREPYPRQRVSFLPLRYLRRGRSPPHSRTPAPFPKHRPRPSGPPSRCRPVGVSIRFIHPSSVDANKKDSGNLV